MGTNPGGRYKTRPKAALPVVLAVDDFFLNLKLIKNTLSDIVNLYTVTSAMNALTVLGMVKVDLMLLDLQMPEMDGFELLERLRATPAYESLPVIIITSDVKAKTLEKAVRYGIIDYIVKPFEPSLLREKAIRAVANLQSFPEDTANK